MSAMMTDAPSRRKRIVVSRPMPPAPPVMTKVEQVNRGCLGGGGGGIDLTCVLASETARTGDIVGVAVSSHFDAW